MRLHAAVVILCPPAAGKDKRKRFSLPAPHLFREAPAAGADLAGSFPADFRRLRSGCGTALTRGLVLAPAPPAQKFFCASGSRCLPVRSGDGCALGGNRLATRGKDKVGGSSGKKNTP